MTISQKRTLYPSDVLARHSTHHVGPSERSMLRQEENRNRCRTLQEGQRPRQSQWSTTFSC